MKEDTAVSKRCRITVPWADQSVIEWMSKQQNLSHSFRQLVRNYISEYGMTDVTCAPVKLPGTASAPVVRQESPVRTEPERVAQQPPRQEQMPVMPNQNPVTNRQQRPDYGNDNGFAGLLL